MIFVCKQEGKTAYDLALLRQHYNAAAVLLIYNHSVADLNNPQTDLKIKQAFVGYIAEVFLPEEAESSLRLQDNFLEIMTHFAKLLPLEPSPIRTYNRMKEYFFTCLRKLCQQDDPNVFDQAVYMWVGLNDAIESAPSEEVELEQNAAVLENLILEIFNCDAFDEPVKTNELLLNENKTTYEWNQDIRFVPTYLPARIKAVGVPASDMGGIMEEFSKQWRRLQLAHILLNRNILQLCLENRLKTVFGRSQVSSLLDKLLWSYLNPYYVKDVGGGLSTDTRSVHR